MARPSIYKLEVQKARDVLLAQGRHPSIDAVRVELGNTGSKTTIHRYLKELEAEESPRIGSQVAVSEALQDLVARLAERIHAEADERIAAAEAAFTQQRAELHASLDARAEEANGYSSQLQRTEQALLAEKAAHTETREALEQANLKIGQLEELATGLRARLETQETHIQSLEEKHRHVRDALEHFRAAAKDQREQECRRHEQALQLLQVEIRRAGDALTAKQAELLQLNRDNARLVEHSTQMEQQLRELRKEQSRLQERFEQCQPLAQAHPHLRRRCQEADKTIETLEFQVHNRESELAAERERRVEAERQLAATEARLVSLEEHFVRRTETEETAEEMSADQVK